MTYAIEAHKMRKAYQNAHALDGLDLQVPEGVVYGLIGRNGAGKTTLLRALMGVLPLDGGVAQICGIEMNRATANQRAQVAYVAQAQQVHSGMSMAELSELMACFYPAWDAEYAKKLISQFALPWDHAVGNLSGGQLRKVSIALAFATRAKVMLLDEPTAALDPIARRELTDVLIDLISERPETTILISTHNIDDLDRLATHIGMMESGRMTGEYELEKMREGMKRLQLIFEGDAPPAGFDWPHAVSQKVEGSVVHLVVNDFSEGSVEQLKQRWSVRVQVFDLGVEDMVLELMGPRAQAFQEETV